MHPNFCLPHPKISIQKSPKKGSKRMQTQKIQVVPGTIYIWNHPTKTSIYKWLFRVPGGCQLQIIIPNAPHCPRTLGESPKPFGYPNRADLRTQICNASTGHLKVKRLMDFLKQNSEQFNSFQQMFTKLTFKCSKLWFFRQNEFSGVMTPFRIELEVLDLVDLIREICV